MMGIFPTGKAPEGGKQKNENGAACQGLGRTPCLHGYGLIGWHPDRDARPFALLSSCLAEIAAKVVSSDPSELPKAAPPMV